MLTILAIPKAFKGQFDAIQHNAIRSWCQLDPKPEVILFGNDEGTAEIARELGLRHIPDVERNEFETPLIPAIFERGQEAASNQLIAYVNSDIILGDDFMTAVKALASEFKGRQFLGVGRKTSIRLTERLDFTDPGWESRLKERADREGFHVTFDSDFFVFPKGLYSSVPRFAIGRCYWSSWLMWDVRQRGIPMIDLTRVVVSIEPAHDYSHAKSTGGVTRLSGVEFRTNKALFRGCRYYSTVNATQVLTSTGLAPAPLSFPLISLWVRGAYWIYFLLKGDLYPYSIPLILVGRSFVTVGHELVRGVRRMRRQATRRPASTVEA
jgi:hypothetical protein